MSIKIDTYTVLEFSTTPEIGGAGMNGTTVRDETPEAVLARELAILRCDDPGVIGQDQRRLADKLTEALRNSGWQMHKPLGDSPGATGAMVLGIDAAVTVTHAASRQAGWYHDPKTGMPLERNVGEMMALIHSEISEALEGYRKDLMDDKLPHRKAVEVELADALIRIFDLAGYLKLDLASAVLEKLKYNQTRIDHTLEARAAAGGKKF